jgi:hypothetical protein
MQENIIIPLSVSYVNVLWKQKKTIILQYG